jgi:hypothetical protein
MRQTKFSTFPHSIAFAQLGKKREALWGSLVAAVRIFYHSQSIIMIHIRQLLAVFCLAIALVGLSWNHHQSPDDPTNRSRRLGAPGSSVTTTINTDTGIRATTTKKSKKPAKKFDPKTVQYKAGAAAAADLTKLQGTKTAKSDKKKSKKKSKKQKKKLFSLKPSKRQSIKDKITTKEDAKKAKKSNTKASKKL